MAGQLEIFTELDECSRACAAYVSRRLVRAVSLQGRATLVLAGGKTPRRLYELLAAGEPGPPLNWERIHLFWGDERFVPWDSPESNYAFAREHLVSRIRIPEENVHRMPVEKATPELVAMEYETLLRSFFAKDREAEDGDQTLPPRFDVVLLGIGQDGHTASLFHGADLAAVKHWVVASRSSVALPPVPRVTLTLSLLNRARAVVFLAAGAGKRLLVEAIAAGAGGAEVCPAACVRPEGDLVWYVADHEPAAPTDR